MTERGRLQVLLGAALALCLSSEVRATPFVPTDDALVVETLPATTRLMRSLQGPVAAKASDLPAALVTARRFVELSRVEGDPRYLGYAHSTLGPWWDGDDPRVVLLRATIRQSLHQFDPALQDLRTLTGRAPDDVQAWLTRATVEQVRGDYRAAAESCKQVLRLTRNLIGQVCMADAASLLGDFGPGQALRRLIASDRSIDPSTRGWLATVLAEMAQRAGDDTGAGPLFEQALRDDPSLYLRGAYADYLLEHARNDEALAVSRWSGSGDWSAWPDALLLRQVLALSASGRTDQLEAPRQQLVARFDAERQRGEALHQREEARYVLDVAHDAPRALQLARQNWQQQKEPADLLILVRAARAANRRDVLDEVATYVAQLGYVDRRLTPLLALAP